MIGHGIVMIFRPVHVRQPAIKDERMRAQGIVEKYGCTSLAYFTLFEDKSYFFSPNGSVIAYAVEGRIAPALGDPIGAEMDVEPVIAAFNGFCTDKGWQVCFYQVQPDYLNIYKAAGFNAMGIGQEAIVDLVNVTVENKAGKKIRNVTNRLTQLGHRVEIYDPPKISLIRDGKDATWSILGSPACPPSQSGLSAPITTRILAEYLSKLEVEKGTFRKSSAIYAVVQ